MSEKKRRKSSKAVMMERIDIILKLRLAMYGYTEICQYITENYKWKVCERTIERYIELADKEIEKTRIPERIEWMKQAKARLDALYKDAYDEGKKTECRRLIESINKVLGFEKIVFEGEIKQPLSDWDLKKLTKSELKELEKLIEKITPPGS